MKRALVNWWIAFGMVKCRLCTHRDKTIYFTPEQLTLKWKEEKRNGGPKMNSHFIEFRRFCHSTVMRNEDDDVRFSLTAIHAPAPCVSFVRARFCTNPYVQFFLKESGSGSVIRGMDAAHASNVLMCSTLWRTIWLLCMASVERVLFLIGAAWAACWMEHWLHKSTMDEPWHRYVRYTIESQHWTACNN